MSILDTGHGAIIRNIIVTAYCAHGSAFERPKVLRCLLLFSRVTKRIGVEQIWLYTLWTRRRYTKFINDSSPSPHLVVVLIRFARDARKPQSHRLQPSCIDAGASLISCSPQGTVAGRFPLSCASCVVFITYAVCQSSIFTYCVLQTVNCSNKKKKKTKMSRSLDRLEYAICGNIGTSVSHDSPPQIKCNNVIF